MSRIFVIDDDRSVRHLIAKAFEDSDVEVVPAASAEEGMRLLDGVAVGCRVARYSACPNRRVSTCSKRFARPIRSCR